MLLLEVSFSKDEFRRKNIDTAQLAALLKKTEQQVRPAPPPEGILSLILVDDSTIQDLNRRYRQKDQPTDVLSFLLQQSDSQKLPEQIFGEIYISVPTALRQAKNRGHSLQQEMNTLFVHGVLHLLGYDHENETNFQRMNGLEKMILNSQ